MARQRRDAPIYPFIKLFIWSFFRAEFRRPSAHRLKVNRERASGRRGQAGRRTNSGADATPHSASQSHCGEVGSGGAATICEAPSAPSAPATPLSIFPNTIMAT